MKYCWHTYYHGTCGAVSSGTNSEHVRVGMASQYKEIGIARARASPSGGLRPRLRLILEGGPQTMLTERKKLRYARNVGGFGQNNLSVYS